MEQVKFDIYSELTAFEGNAIGTKVGKPDAFFEALATAVENHDTGNDRAPGQHFIVLPLEVVESAQVGAGIGKRTENPDDFVLRCYRDRVAAYLKREAALPVSFLACVVYTTEAFLDDPDVVNKGITAEILEDGTTHVVVAVIANSEGVNDAPYTPLRACSNIGGGNKEAKTWTLEKTRKVCRSSAEFAKTFSVVADDPE